MSFLESRPKLMEIVIQTEREMKNEYKRMYSYDRLPSSSEDIVKRRTELGVVQKKLLQILKNFETQINSFGFGKEVRKSIDKPLFAIHERLVKEKMFLSNLTSYYRLGELTMKVVSVVRRAESLGFKMSPEEEAIIKEIDKGEADLLCSILDKKIKPFHIPQK